MTHETLMKGKEIDNTIQKLKKLEQIMRFSFPEYKNDRWNSSVPIVIHDSAIDEELRILILEFAANKIAELEKEFENL